MANTAGLVTTGKPKITGAVYVAPKGTEAPTDATTSLSGAFVGLGYVSEDGLSNSNELNVSEIKAWGGVTVYRSLTDMTDEFSLTLIESENLDVMKTIYGSANVTSTATSSILPIGGYDTASIDVKVNDPEEMVWVFELALRNGKKKRIVIPDGAITAREEITYNDSDAVGYGITVSAYPDANGSTHKEYIAA
jgi:hypothetical protein